jgi:hypothetical protein
MGTNTIHRSRSGVKVLHINIEDILVTRQIVEAGKLLDTEVLDHIILGKGRWLSMREKGLGF